MKKKGFMKDRDIATYENIEKLRIMSVIYDIKYQKKIRIVSHNGSM